MSDLAEAVQELARVDHEDSSDTRRVVCEGMLCHPDPNVRDAATLALTHIESWQSIVPLKKALETETDRFVQREIEWLIKHLESKLRPNAITPEMMIE